MEFDVYTDNYYTVSFLSKDIDSLRIALKKYINKNPKDFENVKQIKIVTKSGDKVKEYSL